MKINVTYIPQEHQAIMFWYKNHKLTGIAEWEDTFECDHDNVEYDVESDGGEVLINDIYCPDCELSDEDKKMLENKFNYDEYWSSKHDIDVDYYMELGL